MDLIQLKMPPERAQLVAEAIARDIKANPGTEDSRALQEVLVWLVYRVQRWRQHHPTTPAA